MNNCPKFLRKLNKLENAFKRSRYRHLPYRNTNATYSKGSLNLLAKRL